MKTICTLQLLIVTMAFSILTFGQSPSANLDMVYKIKTEGQSNSDMETLSYILTDLAGPRLTGSPGYDRGAGIAKAKMIEYGFSNVRIEKADDFRNGGWEYNRAYAAMTTPYYCNFSVTPLAWTGGTDGLIRCEVALVEVNTDEDLEKYKGKLKDKAVILSMPTLRPAAEYQVSFEPLASRYSDEQLEDLAKAPQPRNGNYGRTMGDWRKAMDLREKINAFIIAEGAAIIIDNGNAFNIPRSSGGRYDGSDTIPLPEVSIPMEAYGRLQRLIRHGEKVEIEADIHCTFTPGKEVYNVIGEIPGTDPRLKDEIVLLGAHLDSWHGGTGAADDASGCMVMMEALRILKALNVSPRRTIRIALWGGEEQGLLGSRGYVNKYLYDGKTKQQKTGYDKFSVYFNMDNGTGRYRGVYLQGNDMMRPVFEEWMKPFNDMDFKTITIRNTGGTDHLSFDAAGLPGFQFIQDEIEYGRGYHTSMDTWERLLINDLKQNAIITAWFAYNAAMRDQLMPRKPEVKLKKEGRPAF